MTFNLIFPAMLVFTLMLIGVVLTTIEFKNELKEEESKDKGRRKRTGT